MAKKTEIETSTKTEIEVEDKTATLDPEHLALILGDLKEISMYADSKIARVGKISDPKMQIVEAFGALDVIRTMCRSTEAKVCKAECEFEEDSTTGSGMGEQVSLSVYASGPSSMLR
jgi:hypothetical protein